MNSLRARLFILVGALTMLVWSGAAVWTALSSRAEVERVLDNRLVEAARMVAALDVPSSGRARRLEPAPYSRQLSCQIWSLDGDLVGQSAGAPDAPLATGSAGFSERKVGGQAWRVYTHVDAARGIRVMVGDNMAVREGLVRDLMLGLLLPGVLGVVALALVLWLAVRGGLAPLGRITRELDRRDPVSLDAMAVDPVPDELQPLVRAMDSLLARLAAARQAELDFVANAAHELQTPLAGLKTQAEVARRATDPAMRDHALERITTSVDRTSRLVRQLLELARQEARQAVPEQHFTPVAQVLGEISSDYAHLASERGKPVRTRSPCPGVEIAIEREALLLALKNLVENALQHGGKGPVSIECIEEDGIQLRVVDTGSGIAAEQREQVRRRFQRGPGAPPGGTGLGLSIAEAAVRAADGTLEFRHGESGFAAVLRFPAHRVRRSN